MSHYTGPPSKPVPSWAKVASGLSLHIAEVVVENAEFQTLPHRGMAWT